MTEETNNHKSGISQVRTYLSCARKWGYWRDGHKEPSKWAFIAGSAMDATLNEHHEERRRGGRLPVSYLQDYYLNALNAELEKQGSPPGESEYNDNVAAGTRILPVYMDKYDKFCEPVGVQVEVQATIGNTPFRSFVDLLRTPVGGGDTIIADHKFVGRAPSPDVASSSLQLAAYSYCLGFRQVEIVSLLKRKKDPDVLVTPHFVTDDDIANLIRLFKQVEKLKTTKVYMMADPGGFMSPCSSTYCVYWNICRGRHGGPLPISDEQDG